MILNFKIGKNDKIYFLWCSSLRVENLLDKKYSAATLKKPSGGGAAKHSEAVIPFISSCDTEKIAVTYPNSVNLFQYSNQGKPIKVQKSILCKNCDVKVEQHKICDITFRTLVEAHDSRKRDKEYNKLFERINITSSGVELLPYIANKGQEGEDKQQKLLVLKNYKNLLIPKVIFALYPKLNYEDYKVLKKDTVFLCKNTQVCEKCFLDLTKYCSFSGANTQNVLRVLKSKIPDDFYVIRKDASNAASEFSSSGKGFGGKASAAASGRIANFNKLIAENSFGNFAASEKFRAKTPGFSSNQNYSAINSMRGKRNNDSNSMIKHNKYKPDFSSKIKFIVQPKKDFACNNIIYKGVKNKEMEALIINSVEEMNSNLNSNQKQGMSITEVSTRNNHNNPIYNSNGLFSQNNNNIYINNSNSLTSNVNSCSNNQFNMQNANEL